MASKLDWTRTQPGRGGADERIGGDWRNGPRDDLSIVDSDEHSLPPDYLALPGIYWAANLKKAFPEENDDAHALLQRTARLAALRLYRLHSVNTLLSRTLVFYSRASANRPFPSAYFAAYFDFATMSIALSKSARHVPPPRRNLRKFYSYGEFQLRCHLCSRKMMDAEGGFRALADRVLGITGDKLTSRGFPGF